MTTINHLLNRYVMPDMPSTDELISYLREVEGNKWYSNFGPLVMRFESALNQKFNAHSVTLASCYHALQIALQLFRIQENAPVLVPAVTFPACPLAVSHAGGRTVLADVDAATWQLSPNTARKVAATMPLGAVMPVAIYGVPVPVEAWDKFTEDTGVPVIIDAAAALDAQPIPKNGFAAFSLHATKPFSVGEGGLLIGRNRDAIKEARSIANFGTELRITLRNGMNAKLSEYHGAVALAQLDRWNGIKERRRKTFALYQKYISAQADLSLQPGIEHAITSALMIRTARSNAAAVVNALNGRGIAAHRMYLPPLYHHPHFENLDVIGFNGDVVKGGESVEKKMAAMINSEAMHRDVFGLPFHAFLGDEDVEEVVQVAAEI